MPRVPAHLRECTLCMLQGGMRTVDVARAINCNVHTVRRLSQCYREIGWTSDRPHSGRPCVTTPWSGAVSQHHRTELVVTAGNLNAVRYREDILLPHVVPLLQAHPDMTPPAWQCQQPYCSFCAWFPARQECQCSAMVSEEPESQSHWARLGPVG